MKTFAVLLDCDVRPDIRPVADIVAPEFGMTKLEAKLLLKKGRGVLVSGITQETARKVVEVLKLQGVAGFALDVAMYPAKPFKVLEVSLDEDFVTYKRSDTFAMEALALTEILSITACVMCRPEFIDLFVKVPDKSLPPLRELTREEANLVKENIILQMQTPGGSNSEKKKNGKSVLDLVAEEWSGKVRNYIDLVAAGFHAWIRIPCDESIYKLGNVKVSGPLAFKHMLLDLQKRCGAALFDPVSLKLKEETDINNVVVLHIEELNNYSRWWAIKREMSCRKESSSQSQEQAE